MKCPVCGDDCISSADVILDVVPDVFSPCPRCRFRVLDKQRPPPPHFTGPCDCGKRFIDDVFSQMYSICTEEGVLSGSEPLSSIGMPLLHPGFAMVRPPFLPARTLVIVSDIITRKCAERITREVPEVRGVVRRGEFVPGITDPEMKGTPRAYSLLSGCDVRAGIFRTSAGPVVIFLQQSLIHIEFPRHYNPKIGAVERQIALQHPHVFIDAACGAGTLGLAAARNDIRSVILNDAWYAASFWSAINLSVNAGFYHIDSVRINSRLSHMKRNPVGGIPKKIAETRGEQSIEVYHGDFFRLHALLPRDSHAVTVLDLFDKEKPEIVGPILSRLRCLLPGDVFIP